MSNLNSAVDPRDVRIYDPSPAADLSKYDAIEKARKNRLLIARRRARVAALYATDNHISAIIEQVAEEFEMEVPMTVSQVRNDVKAQIDFWRREGLKHIDDKQAAVLASIQNVEDLATQAYIASCEGKATYNHEKQIEQMKARSSKKGQNEQDELRERGIEHKRKDLLQEELEWDESVESEGESDDEAIRALETVAIRTKQYKRFEESKAGDSQFLRLMLDCAKERAKIYGLYVRDNVDLNSDTAFAKMSDADKTSRMAMILSQVKSRLPDAPTHLAAPAPLGGPKQMEQLTEGEANVISDVIVPARTLVASSVGNDNFDDWDSFDTRKT